MSRYHIVLDRLTMAMGFFDIRDSVSHYTPEALKESVDFRLRGIEDILAHPGAKRIIRSIQRSKINELRGDVRFILKELFARDNGLYKECQTKYYDLLRRL